MTSIYQILVSIIIGIVQGISEWLPISSKTQILVVSNLLLHLTFQQAYSFGLFMEIGTLAAAIIYFRQELIRLIKVLLGSKVKEDRKLLVYVVVTTVMTGIIGAPLYLIADSITGLTVGIPMLIIGLVLMIDAVVIWHSRRRQATGTTGRKFHELRLKDYILVGIAQGISALPGVSRSGITTSTMLLMKVEPDEAFRLSFLIGIFATLAAACLTIVASHSNITASVSAIGTTGLIVAIVVSAIISLFLIDFLIKIAGKSKIVYVTAGLGLIAIASGSIYLIFRL
jgi:undecaprenyl-diphosphatase